MPTQGARTHHVGKRALLRDTSPKIVEVISKVAGYDGKMTEKTWEEGNSEVLIEAFARTGKDPLSWGEQTVEHKNA